VIVFWSLTNAAGTGALTLARAVVFAQSAVGVSMIAFGGLNWALDGAAAPVGAVLRLESAMAPVGALSSGERSAAKMPAREIRFRDVSFAYPGGQPVLEHLDLTIPPGRRSRSSGRTAPARRRSPNCCAACTTRKQARSRPTRQSARSRHRVVALACDRRLSGFHALRALAA
jgi:hypothetical protein